MERKNDYTLISLIGTGMYNEKEGGYRKVIYQFQDKTKIESTLFIDALFESNYAKVIKKVIIVGTISSDWSALLAKFEKKDKEIENLRISIYEEVSSKKKLSEFSKNELEKCLSNIYQIPCILKLHTDCVDFNTVNEIFEVYNSIKDELLDGTDILFDITHGFRSMPVLLYQTLQYSLLNLGKKLELIYGEYIPTEKISYVRDLSKYWELSEITRGCSIFYNTLDGTILMPYVKQYWESGTKWLQQFTNIVNVNFSLQLKECLAQLKNAINEFEASKEDKPQWTKELIQFLKNLYKNIYDDKMSKLLFNYAVFLAEKKLYAQAIIALQITVETFVLESMNAPDHFGDYAFIKDSVNVNDELRRMVKEKSQLEKIWKITSLRNQIAHGGGKNKSGGLPPVNNLDSQFSRGKAAIEKLITRTT